MNNKAHAAMLMAISDSFLHFYHEHLDPHLKHLADRWSLKQLRQALLEMKLNEPQAKNILKATKHFEPGKLTPAAALGVAILFLESAIPYLKPDRHPSPHWRVKMSLGRLQKIARTEVPPEREMLLDIEQAEEAIQVHAKVLQQIYGHNKRQINHAILKEKSA